MLISPLSCPCRSMQVQFLPRYSEDASTDSDFTGPSTSQPTLNPDSSTLVKDWVLLNRYAALAAQQGYKDSFKPGDVVALK